MSEQTDNLLSLLLPYGLETDEARVYLELLENGVGSALTLSRSLRLARTKVYRILDKLEKVGLVVIHLHERGQRYEAANPKQLSILITDKEQTVAKLKSSLVILEEQLGRIVNAGKKESKVLYYRGVEGLKQVTYNSLRAKGELLTFEIKDMNAFFDYDYAEAMRLKFIERKIHIRTLTNVTYVAPWTDIAGEMVEKFWEIRHIPEAQMRIKFEILIYNNVYVMYRYKEKEIFCVEIYNQELADMQRQIFEYIWQKARRFKVLNKQGEAKLIKGV